LISFTLGAVSFSLQVKDFQSTNVYYGERVVVGRVIEKKTDGKSHAVVLDNLSVDGDEVEGKIIVYVPDAAYEGLSLSKETLMLGTVQTNVDLLGEYGFRGYVIDEDVRYTMNTAKCVVVGDDFNVFLEIRNRLEKVVVQGMDETPAAVTIATLTGNTTFIEEGLLRNIRRGGIAHIFAVSGLHVGALYAFCLWIISKTKLRLTPKTVRFILVAFVLVFYGGICGFSASVIRATVMCLLLYFAKLVGLGSDTLETVSVAAIVVLLLSPVSLFTVGFQLSFAACVGIVLLSRPISKVMYFTGDFITHKVFRKPKKAFVLEEDTHPLNVRQRVVRAVVSFLSVTVSAQLATLPIQIAAFKQISVWSLLLNVMFVPLIGALFSALLIFVFLACILPTAWCGVVLYLPNVVWSALFLPFEAYSFAAFSISVFPVWAMVAYYVSLSFCSGKWNLPKWIMATISSLFLTVGIVIFILANV